MKLREIVELPLPYEPDNDQRVLSEDELGYNCALSEIGELEVVVDVKELALIIYGKTNYKTGDLTACAGIATSISSNIKQWLRVK